MTTRYAVFQEMGASNFNIRVPDETIAALDELAAECKVTRSDVIRWSMDAYIELFKANGMRMLTLSDLDSVIDYVRVRSQGGAPHLSVLKAAETPHEPGKIIDPAAAGGAGSVPGKNYPKATKRRSSH